MTAPDLVAMNQAMSARLQAAPAQPLVQGGYALRAVRTTGRRSGTSRTTPLAVVQLDGREYLVSPDPTRAWVRNLEAEPACELVSADETVQRTAVRAAAAEAAPVISAYLRSMQVPWALRAFPVPAEASIAEITEHIATIVTFRLDPR
ncbi:nitroreductase/quinone reductase family protein [Pseudonocardia sp. GCM10023141]|uniref:nitroreductase/quinone reductase family protein n=1 Tax=Pseudonocardia sp. GCM10023141 TaxID=3252653 RepID=UPI003612A711